MILEQLEIVQMNSLLRDQDFVDKLLFFIVKHDIYKLSFNIRLGLIDINTNYCCCCILNCNFKLII